MVSPFTALVIAADNVLYALVGVVQSEQASEPPVLSTYHFFAPVVIGVFQETCALESDTTPLASLFTK